jgi:hypothetical protein
MPRHVVPRTPGKNSLFIDLPAPRAFSGTHAQGSQGDTQRPRIQVISIGPGKALSLRYDGSITCLILERAPAAKYFGLRKESGRGLRDYEPVVDLELPPSDSRHFFILLVKYYKMNTGLHK